MPVSNNSQKEKEQDNADLLYYHLFSKCFSCRASYPICFIHFSLYQSSWRNNNKGKKVQVMIHVLYLVLPQSWQQEAVVGNRARNREAEGTAVPQLPCSTCVGIGVI